MIVFAGIVPHPPALIPQIGKGEEEKIALTKKSLIKLGQKLVESEPDVIIFITPHMAHYPHLFNVCGMSDLFGSFRFFGYENYEWHGHNDTELAAEIVDKSEDEGLPTILYDNGEGEYELDHGITVPYFFLKDQIDFTHDILPIGYSSASRGEHYTFGQVISEVCERKTSTRVAIIASGDLSHRIGQKSQSGEHYRGEEFDRELINLLEAGDEYSIVNMNEELVESAGECAYRSILILLGAIAGKEFKPEVYSYENPFGVSYMVANMNIVEK